jgi:hypothetical protein
MVRLANDWREQGELPPLTVTQLAARLKPVEVFFEQRHTRLVVDFDCAQDVFLDHGVRATLKGRGTLSDAQMW